MVGWFGFTRLAVAGWLAGLVGWLVDSVILRLHDVNTCVMLPKRPERGAIGGVFVVPRARERVLAYNI